MNYSRSVLAALLFLPGALMLAACDKFDDDVQPAKMNMLKVHDDFYTTGKNQGIYLDVLANDTIGSQTTIRFGQPKHGTLQPDTLPGRLYYMPENNFTGTDHFTYEACMDNTCATARVTILVKPDSVIIPPCMVIAANDAATVTENKTITINILQNDTICAAVPVISQPPLNGQAYINPANQLVYTPHLNYKGTDRVQYTLTGTHNSSAAYVNITIRPDSTIPPPCTLKANPDTVTLIHNIQYTDTISIPVLKNDKVCGGSMVTIMKLPVPQLQYGTVFLDTLSQSRRFIYTTSVGMKNINDKFRYRICQAINGQQVCSEAEVLIRIR